MDMSSTTMAAMTGTVTGTAASATATASMSMGGMGGGCKISMLWNWNVIDTCFIASSWHITSKGMFAGSCIGVILLVMSLELLRRSVKEYDGYLIRQHAASVAAAAGARGASIASSNNESSNNGQAEAEADAPKSTITCAGAASTKFRPTIAQQAIRALLHMVQFAVAYFVMLLAMYYNGYFIICILIGAYLGSFVFHWEYLEAGRVGQTSATKEPTVCCA